MKINFYGVAEKIDLIIKKEKPELEEQNKILGLLKTESYANYFFKKVEKPFWFKILLRKGFFDSSPEPIQGKDKESYVIPFWAPLQYLEKISKYPEFSDELINIMQRITKDKVDNYLTYYVFTKMSVNFPSAKSAKVVPLVKSWLINSRFNNSVISAELIKLLKYLLENNQIDAALELIEIVTETKEEKQKVFEFNKAEAIVDIYWLKKLIRENINLIIEKCPKKAIGIVCQNLVKAIEIEHKNTNNGIYRDGSYIWRPAIEEHTQNSSSLDIKEILVISIRDILVSTIKKGNKAENITKDFMSHKMPIFRRLAIFIFTEFTGKFKDIIENEFLKDKKIFSDRSVHHELYQFIKMQFRNLSKDSQKFILNSIKKGPESIRPGIKDEKRERRIKIWKQRWLTALEGQGVKDAEDFLRNLRKETGVKKIEHPDFLFYSETYWDKESGVNVKEILKKDNKEIAKYLKNFKETGRFRDPTIEGLGGFISATVGKNPSRFENNLDPFLDVPFYFLNEIIWAFEKLWNENKEINWEKILGFCKRLVKDDNFWKEERDGKRFWLTGTISNLIESGTKKDEHAFDEKYLSIAREILIEIARKETDSSNDLSDPVTAALNSAKGKTLSSLLNYALRYARTKYKDKEKTPLKKWEKEVEELFTERLDKNIDKSLEVHTIIGQYLPQFLYLDRDWVTGHLRDIFPEKKEYQKYWEAAFAGYLFNNMVHGDIYEILRNEYERAIKTEFRDSNAQRRLAKHLCVAYLWGKERLDAQDSLIKFYLDNANSAQMQESIGFLWGLYKDKQFIPGHREKVLNFWKYRYRKVIKKTNVEEYKKEISDYIKLCVFVDEINDEIYEILKFSIKYAAEADYNITEAIEFFKRNSAKYPKQIAELFSIMIDNCQVMTGYEKEDIREIFVNLYEAKDPEIKKLADRIINKYGEKGIEDFRDLYEKYKN